jgi:hypothetical protein
MPDPEPNVQYSLVGEPIPNSEPLAADSPSSKGRRFLSTVLSAIVPGTGHLLAGQRRRGLILVIVFAALLLCFWPLRLLRFYWGFLLLYSSWIIIYLYASATAYRVTISPLSNRPSRWWLVAILPSSLLASSLIGAPLTRLAGFRSFSIPSSSMEQTIAQGDHIVVDTLHYRGRGPARQDVIVFFKDHTYFIKRVGAVGGDTIQGKRLRSWSTEAP